MTLFLALKLFGLAGIVFIGLVLYAAVKVGAEAEARRVGN